MAKRFTDTDKWNKVWFSELPIDLKLFWIYLLDQCDIAGVWSENYKLASFMIGTEVNRTLLERAFGDRFTRLSEDKIFISKFIEFQYGALSKDCKPHQSVIKILKKYSIEPENLRVSKGYPKGIHTLKDKEKDKDQYKYKEKEQDKEQDKEKDKDSAILKERVKYIWEEDLA